MTSEYSWESELRHRYPMPDVSKVKEYYFSLDGGGRELIIEELAKNSVELMIEIGCFLCGSTQDWLKAAGSLKVIGIYHWALDAAAILDGYDGNPVFEPCFKEIDDRDEFIGSVRSKGSFLSAMANIKKYSNRFYPVKESSPEALYVLHELGVKPDLIYIDSDKVLNDLDVCKEIFPQAILCGDDWTWGADKGFPVQKAVSAFCKRTRAQVSVKRATWVIHAAESSD
jgi:hypothetical protein